MTASKKYVEINQVHRIFGSGKKRYYALADINLQIAEGEFVTLIGHSGCGKSTLLNLLAGLDLASSGSVVVDNRVVSGPGLDRAVVFQSHSLLPWMTVEENVKLAVDAVMPDAPVEKRWLEARRWVNTVHLTPHAKKKPGELSGGMKQRVGIARAFATNPKLLLMDEPFGALDALTRGSMQDELLQLWEAERRTVVMITHDVDEAIFLSDRIVLMSNGPQAQIAKILTVDLPRPRTREKAIEHPRYIQLRKELMHYLIETGHALSAA